MLAAATGALWWTSQHNLTARDGEEHLLYIYPETPAAYLTKILQRDYDIRSPRLLEWEWKARRGHSYPSGASASSPNPGEQLSEEYLKTGCYRIPAEVSDKALIRMLRTGRQTPVRLTFSSVRTPDQLAKRLSTQLMIDSAAIASRLTDSAYMADYGLTLPCALCLFIPNTYEVWWNMSADDLFSRMNREYQAFWTEERLRLAEQMRLTPQEVVTLASIVEEETRLDSDKPIVAGLYLNRLRRGMLLQADPTVKYAVGDFALRRILKEHLRTDSPYNTYRYKGLPPGPIRTPSPRTVDLTLHYTPSAYLYMCASPALDGTHRFSSSYAEHMRNARAYQRELNRRGIRK